MTIYLYDQNSQYLGQGSGFLVGSNGEIATNYHVIEGATYATAKFPDNDKVFPVTDILHKDEFHDLAVVKIDMDTEPLPLGENDNYQIGEEITSIGSLKGYTGTVSDGIISSRREIVGFEHMQITTPISPGSSGGPVINDKGEVIGIVVRTRLDAQNLNFAVPVKHLKDLMAQPATETPFANVIYVNNDGDPYKDLINIINPSTVGKNWTQSYTSLQDALGVAKRGDEIWVAEGTYQPDQGEGQTVGNRYASFYLVSGVRMYGGFKGTETSRTPLGDHNKTILSGEIDQNSSRHSLHVVKGSSLDSTTVLDGFRITSGNANLESWSSVGGGMYNYTSSSPTLINCVFTNNSALDGSGGGICDWNASSPILRNCVFSYNTAEGVVTGGAGGGIYNGLSSPVLVNCIFIGNKAMHFPGSRFGNGGGMYNASASSPTLTNCVFTNNSANKHAGAIRNNSSSPTLINCTFANNTADEGGAIHHAGGSSSSLANCILWGNFASSDNFNQLDGNWTNLSVVPIVVQAWTGDARAMSADPLFNNMDNPIGPDGIWFTDDDGLRLKSGSPAIDVGHNASLPVDTFDLDGDGNKTESIPYDLLARNRLVGTAVDLGPYEFDPANPPPVVVRIFTVNLLQTDGGTVTGGGEIAENNQTTLRATPLPGYVFSHWSVRVVPFSGYDFSDWSDESTSHANPLELSITNHLSIEASFAHDLNDTDGDGLSNYAEILTHETNVDDNDTDDDGLLDGEEIQIGMNPKSSDATLVNFFNAKAATRETNARTSALAEGQAAGVEAVKAKPSDYGLRTESDLNASVDSAVATARNAALIEGQAVGINAVNAKPGDYGLYSQTDLNASVNTAVTTARTSALSEGKEQGQATGINAVKAKPNDYGLFAAADVNASVVASRNVALAEGRTDGIAAVKANPFQHGLYTQADLNASTASARTSGIEEGKALGRSEGQAAVKADPTAHNLVTKDAYDQMVEQLINSSDSGSTTPFVLGWFYYPNRGWMYTKRNIYPYFYDSSTKSWMYFKSGEDKPRFYHYGTKAWVTLGE